LDDALGGDSGTTPDGKCAPSTEGTPGAETHADVTTDDASFSAAPDPIVPIPDPRDLACAEKALHTVRHELAKLETHTDVRPLAVGSRTDRADRTVDHLRYLDSLRRPLRVLRAGLLLSLRNISAWRLTGYASFAALVEAELSLSERAARDLLDEAHRFERDPHLAWAYESGQIGAGQARLIYRFATDRTQDAWVQRSASVTHTQLEREVRLLTRLDLTAPSLHGGEPFPGRARTDGRASTPFTPAEFVREVLEVGRYDAESVREVLEAGLYDRAGDLGWTPAMLDASLPGPLTSDDPAHDPRILERLHILIDLLELELRPEAPPISINSEPSSTEGNRQTLSTTKPTPGRQTLSARSRDRHLVLRLPPHVHLHWLEVAYRTQLIHGPLPDWVILTLVADAARSEWLRVDPASRPREHHVLQRDGWRCRAPGCTARRMLEVHHIAFRSQGGTDTEDNKITLCHAHHRRGIHDHSVHLRGHAPADLRWRLGRPESTHAETFRGEVRIRDSRSPRGAAGFRSARHLALGVGNAEPGEVY